MIKVSVVVPVYNKEEYIGECIESLINQTLKDIEIIVVNDGSTDSSLAKIEKYQKTYGNIKIINQENKGLGSARNAGIREARGEYVGFVDADDFVDKAMYEELYNQAINKNSDLVICDYLFYPSPVSSKKKWFNKYMGILDAKFLDKNTQPWNKIVSKKLLDQIKFEFFEKNGDGAYIDVFLNAKNIVTIDDKLYNYRVGQESMSTNYSNEHYKREVEVAYKQREILHKSKYSGILDEYFNYRIIYTLIQAITVALINGEKQLYNLYRDKLKGMDYKKNEYIHFLLKGQFSKVKFYGILYILPCNYYLSKIIAQKVMKK